MKAALKAAGLLKVMLELLELLFGLLRKSYEYPNYVGNVLKAYGLLEKKWCNYTDCQRNFSRI